MLLLAAFSLLNSCALYGFWGLILGLSAGSSILLEPFASFTFNLNEITCFWVVQENNFTNTYTKQSLLSSLYLIKKTPVVIDLSFIVVFSFPLYFEIPLFILLY